MAKRGSRKYASADWNSYGYLYVHNFSRWRAVWLLVSALTILGSAVWFGPHFLLDSAYHPVWTTPRCYGRGCGFGIAIFVTVYLLLLLPIWLKAPIAGIISGEVLLWLLTTLKFSFDNYPDFAVGPEGIYGLCRLNYYHVPWKQVTSIHLERRISLFNETEVLRIYTKMPCKPHWFWTRGKPWPVRFLLPPLAGISVQKLRTELLEIKPEKKIIETNADLRPWWFR